MQVHQPTISSKSKILENKLGVIGIEVYDHSTTIKEKFNATCCDEINKLIKEKKIDCVLIPVYVEDEEHWQYYKLIANEIQNVSNVEIIGLII